MVIRLNVTIICNIWIKVIYFTAWIEFKALMGFKD